MFIYVTDEENAKNYCRDGEYLWRHLQQQQRQRHQHIVMRHRQFYQFSTDFMNIHKTLINFLLDICTIFSKFDRASVHAFNTDQNRAQHIASSVLFLCMMFLSYYCCSMPCHAMRKEMPLKFASTNFSRVFIIVAMLHCMCVRANDVPTKQYVCIRVCLFFNQQRLKQYTT